MQIAFTKKTVIAMAVLMQLLLLVSGVAFGADEADFIEPDDYKSALQKQIDRKKSLRAKIRPLFISARSNGPLQFVLDLEWGGKEMLTMEIRIVCNHREIPYGKLTISGGKQEKLIQLPPLNEIAFSSAVVEVGIQAQRDDIPEKGWQELCSCTVSVPSKSQKWYKLGFVTEGYLPQSQIADIAKRLAFERQLPKKIGTYGLPQLLADKIIQTGKSSMRAEDFPENALLLCSYDVLVFPGGISGLGRNGLRSLRTWVGAGGSAMVAMSSLMDDRHVEFLNQLTGGKDYRLSGSGTVIPIARTAGGFRYVNYGLGRLVIFEHELSKENWPENYLWNQVGRFLWKIRSGINSNPKGVEADTGFAEAIESYESVMSENEMYGVNTHDFFKQTRIEHVHGVVEKLLPANLSMVSGSLLVVLSVFFLLVTGPADYIILGKFKRHRYTWLLLPGCIVLFTVMFVLIARHYMGRVDYSTDLVIVDYAGHDSVKTTRLELLYLAGSKEKEFDVKNELFASMDYNSFSGRNTSQNFMNNNGVKIERQYPFDYTVKEQVNQWSPQLNKYVAVGNSPYSCSLNWEDYSPELLYDKGAEELTTSLRKTMENPVQVVVVNGRCSASYSKSVDEEIELEPEFLCEICCRKDDPEFRLVSGVSPMACDSFADTAVLSYGDKYEFVVCIVELKDGKYIIHRKLYRRDGDKWR